MTIVDENILDILSIYSKGILKLLPLTAMPTGKFGFDFKYGRLADKPVDIAPKNGAMSACASLNTFGISIILNDMYD